MSYSISNLTTVEQCDGLLQMLNMRKMGFVNRQSNLNLDLSEGESITASLPMQKLALEAELAGATAAYNSLPPGNAKVNYQLEMNRLESALIRLEKKNDTYGAEARIKQQLEQEEVTRAITAIDDLLPQIEAKKTELQAAA